MSREEEIEFKKEDFKFEKEDIKHKEDIEGLKLPIDEFKLDFMTKTDLIHESYDRIFQQTEAETIPGVKKETEELPYLTSHWLWIENEQASQMIGRKQGVYLTLDVPEMRDLNPDIEYKVTKYFLEQFNQFLQELNIKPDASCLLVGLGNSHVTPDSFGPRVIDHAVITRHLFSMYADSVAKGYRDVSALSPGVMGITGIETSEIIQGVVQYTKPDFIIAFDALAARAVSRVNTTIQVSSTGIHPGSGVGNKRKALDKETIGVPVLAIGVPTVVNAVTIAYDSMQSLLNHLKQQDKSIDWTNLMGQLNQKEQTQLLSEVLTPLGHDFFVTPKEVDSFINSIAKMIANSINSSLHAAVCIDNVGISHVH